MTSTDHTALAAKCREVLLDVARAAHAYSECKLSDGRLQPDIEADAYFTEMVYALGELQTLMAKEATDET